MGCAASSDKSTVGTVTSDATTSDAIYAKLKKRFGHPAYYKADGYDMGIRIKEYVVSIKFIFDSSTTHLFSITERTKFSLYSWQHPKRMVRNTSQLNIT